jgi:hypothetical protein
VSNPAKGGSTPIASRSASPKSYPSNSPPRRPDGEGSSISAYLRLRSHIAKILVQVSSAAIVSKTARSGKQKPYWVPEKTLSSYLAAALSSACFSSPGMWDETRPKKMREQIEAMKEIWTKDRPVSRRVRQLSADDDLAQAGAEAASADHRRLRL